MTRSVRVRKLQAADTPRLLELIDGLADYEKLPRPDADARQRLAADALADPPRFRTLLADVDDGTVVGYAIYFFTYSTFRARSTLYLEDIFVLPAQRGQGAGVALFRACAREAVPWAARAWSGRCSAGTSRQSSSTSAWVRGSSTTGCRFVSMARL